MVMMSSLIFSMGMSMAILEYGLKHVHWRTMRAGSVGISECTKYMSDITEKMSEVGIPLERYSIDKNRDVGIIVQLYWRSVRKICFVYLMEEWATSIIFERKQ